MNDVFTYILAGFAGILLGLFFFGGLWWTIKKKIASPNPGIWFLGSLLVRMSVLLGGVYLMGGGRWERILACLAGVIVARQVVLLYQKKQRLPEAKND